MSVVTANQRWAEDLAGYRARDDEGSASVLVSDEGANESTGERSSSGDRRNRLGRVWLSRYGAVAVFMRLGSCNHSRIRILSVRSS
ncbi:MAG TPA: hypothetical protein VE134_02750 [Methanomicrobiales archaeon]|nr:hypothetical protein [Methanomicrobiales archaeon]